MVGAPPLTMEQRAKVTRAFADAILVELSKLPPLTHERRDRMLRIAGAIIETGRESGQSADDLIPHFATMLALLEYLPMVERGRGRPAKEPRRWFTLTIADEATWTKLERRYMQRIRRLVAGKGRRGPLPQSTFDLTASDAEGLLAMLDQMSASGAGRYAAAYAAAEKPWRDQGGNHPPDVRRLVDAFNRFSERGLADDLPKMLLHRLIAAALDTDDIDEARALTSKL
ncbi:MAG: hypothetical protein IOC49_08365 [Methylobacterium sp.]|nr:hypothetical protein [Methylobacterium sp.]